MNSNYLFASHEYSRSRTLSALVFRTSQSLNAKEMLGKQFQYVQMESQNKSATFLQCGSFKHSAGKKSISPTTDTENCLFQKGESF